MMGVPARQKGWICECGEQLKEDFTCKNCNRKYQKSKETIIQI
jgi:UDP-2-acetamido-3-amino-2,3-dideoxy-glucuronate N-acetyltransferase